MESYEASNIAVHGADRPVLNLDTSHLVSQDPDSTRDLASAVQEAAERVEVLVEKASELLGESLDDSSLNKLAQMSKVIGMEQDHSMDVTGQGESAEDEEGSESHVSAVPYVTAPSSPIVHATALVVSGEELTTNITPSISRRASKDGSQVLGRKLRFTTITGDVGREGRGKSSLEVEFRNLGNASDPGTPNISET